MDTANEARSDEQLERAVDRRPRDLDALLFHFEQELVGVEVIVRGEDLAYERGAFVGDLQPLSGEEILKAVDFALNDRHVDGYLRLSLSCSEHSSVHPSSRQIMIGVVAFLVIFLLAVARKGAFPRQATAIAVASVSEHNRFLLDPLANFERFLLTVEKSQGKLRPHYIITARITGASGPHPPPAGSAAAGAGSTATGSNNRALARSRSSSSNTGRDC